jgi:hypothetical protein
MADLYEEHLQSKQRRKGKVKGKRNPIASSHNHGSRPSGPMDDKRYKKSRRVVDWETEDYDENGNQ